MLWTWVFSYRDVKVTWISMYSNITYHSDSSKENFSSNLGHFTSLVWRPHRSQKNIKVEFLWDFLVRGPGLFYVALADVSPRKQSVTMCLKKTRSCRSVKTEAVQLSVMVSVKGSAVRGHKGLGLRSCHARWVSGWDLLMPRKIKK